MNQGKGNERIFLYYVLCHPSCLADIPTPRPIYSEIRLGEPRLPPYTPNPYLWLLPMGVLVVLYIFSRMRKQSETGTSLSST